METSLIPKVFSEVQRNSFTNNLLEYYEQVCIYNLNSVQNMFKNKLLEFTRSG